MKKSVAVVLIAALCMALGSCSSKSTSNVSFFAMDTYMEIMTCGKNSKEAAERAESIVLSLDSSMNVTDANSDLSKTNAGEKGFWSIDMDNVLLAAERISEMTDGAFDVRVYPVVEAWGFFSGDYRIPEESELKELLSNRDMLDFGGIAKGYASDKAAEVIRFLGVKSALIELGGNIYAVGNNTNGKPWRIAVQDPFDMSSYAGILSLTDTAAITSGAYQRNFEFDGEKYHHIIDPRTGYPADSGLSSVTVVSTDGTLADGLSTGFFVLGRERALEIWRENSELFDLVLIESDGKITITGGLEGSFESSSDFGIEQKQ